MIRELELYRALLVNKRAELLSGLRLKLDTLVRPENPEADGLAELIHEQQVASPLNQIDLLQLHLVTTLLHRLNGDDRGGACAECSEPIADMRQSESDSVDEPQSPMRGSYRPPQPNT